MGQPGGQQQYTILVTVVIGSAVIPTLIAQAFFLPEVAKRERAGARALRHEEVSADVN